MRPSRLALPGGFVPTSAVSSAVELEDVGCAFCFRTVGLGWLHVASQRLLCARCLPDPQVDNAGQRAAARLAELLEREPDDELSISIW